MKRQKAITVAGVRLEPNWLSGYTGIINGKRVRVKQRDGDWIVHAAHWAFMGSTIGGGRTLKAAIQMAKEKVA